MEKLTRLTWPLGLSEGFNIMVYKNIPVYLTVTYSHETLKYLLRAVFTVLNQKKYSGKVSNHQNPDIWEVNVVLNV